MFDRVWWFSDCAVRWVDSGISSGSHCSVEQPSILECEGLHCAVFDADWRNVCSPYVNLIWSPDNNKLSNVIDGQSIYRLQPVLPSTGVGSEFASHYWEATAIPHLAHRLLYTQCIHQPYRILKKQYTVKISIEIWVGNNRIFDTIWHDCFVVKLKVAVFA